MKLDGDFGADFVTATANGRAKSGEQVGGLRAELHLHLPDCFHDDALKCAAPPGVHGGDGARFRINKKNGDTVRSLDAKKQAGTIGRRSVAAAEFGGRSVKQIDNIGMELFERNELEILCSERRLKTAAVFEDVLSGIPFRKPKIQNLFALEIADAAGPSAETMNEPRKLGEPRRLQDSNAPDVAQNPIVR